MKYIATIYFLRERLDEVEKKFHEMGGYVVDNHLWNAIYDKLKKNKKELESAIEVLQGGRDDENGQTL